MEYRKEIDGLRALAVMPVILFHAGFKAFSGGFVGVSIFFVISGYLITSIILAEMQDRKFTLIGFYERRARRILPALFLVMFVTIPCAWLWLAPQDMRSFSLSLVAAPIFSSNVLFWLTSHYFAPAAELKPLLHTWSLAVEEQYYLLFPIFIIFTWRYGRRWMILTLGVLAFASLLLAQWIIDKRPEFTFFMLPTRGWEILSGALLAFYLDGKNGVLISQSINQFISSIGLLLLFIAIFFFDRHTPYPSFYTLIPTIGTVLIILFGNQHTLVGKLLATRIFISIGLISYSAYLWHQPLLSFARHASLEDLSNLDLIALCVATFSLAFLSWRYVEAPFRNKQKFKRKNIYLFSLLFSIIFLSIGIYGYLSKGDIGQLSKEQKEFLAYYENDFPNMQYYKKIGIPEKYRLSCDFLNGPNYRVGSLMQTTYPSISEDCYQASANDKKSVFIWGDSHAQGLYWGLKNNLPGDWNIFQVASSGCNPKIAIQENKNNLCEYSNWFAIEKIIKLKPEVVLIGQNLGHNLEDMKNISEYLLSVGVGKVVFTGPTPHWNGAGLPALVARKMLSNTPRRTFLGLDKGVLLLDREIKSKFPFSEKITYVSVIDELCNDEGCLVYFGDDVKSGLTAFDYGHLSPVTSIEFAQKKLISVLLK